MSKFRGSLLAVVLLAGSVAVPAYGIEPAPQTSQSPLVEIPFHFVRPSTLDLTAPWLPPDREAPLKAVAAPNTPARPLSLPALNVFSTHGINAQMSGGRIQYNFSDVKPLGGALAGQVSGNSAKLTLRWRDSN